MARWAPDARGRLERAALELYGEHGYDATTVAEIAERAGLTERTFFRYFADKREVLFWGAEALQEFLVAQVDAAPPERGPIETITAALGSAADAIFEEMRDQSRQRQDVIDANRELQERELIKLASLAASLAEALRRRGVGDIASSLAAEAGIAAFKVAFDHWVHGDGRRTFAAGIRDSMAELGRLAGAPNPAARR